MRASLMVTAALLFTTFLFPYAEAGQPEILPDVPDTATEWEVAVEEQPPERSTEDIYPARLAIPKIRLDSAIEQMGVLPSGKLDVPNGSTKRVGWYKDGTVPGEQGSAVFDAHVFAAFKRLKELRAGDDVYVLAQDGTLQHFKVEEYRTYKVADVPRDLLFNRSDGKWVNLITCAGKPTADRTNYTHRLVVYARLVE